MVDSATLQLLQSAAGHLQAGRPAACAQACSELLEREPGLLSALHLRGVAEAQRGETHRAIADLSAVWPRQPGNRHAAFWLGRSLRQSGSYQESLAPLEAACGQPELEVDARYERARSLTRLRRPQEAMADYRFILERAPRHADAAANLALLLERANRLHEAGQLAGTALALAPANTIAQLVQATVERRQGNAAAASARLLALLDTGLAPMNRSIALNQLGQCLDRLGDHAAAFERFAESNRILRQQHPDAQPLDSGSYGLATIRGLQQWLQRNPPSSWSILDRAQADRDAAAARASDPVFLVGFPRSGTTLMDQALSAHPDIEVLEEGEFFDEVRRRWVDEGRIRRLPLMTASDIGEARGLYLAQATARRTQPERRVLVDKLPMNLAYLFLVHRLFPAARILFMLRDPRDACLSCFFQSFELQGAMPYFLDLEDTAAIYDGVMSLAMDSAAAIGNPVKFLRYEDLVNGFEATMRESVEFLGLPWHPAVLDYRRLSADRIIDTPSYQQVLEPLHARSIGRWKNYRDPLQPVMRVLDRWALRLGYTAD